MSRKKKKRIKISTVLFYASNSQTLKYMDDKLDIKKKKNRLNEVYPTGKEEVKKRQIVSVLISSNSIMCIHIYIRVQIS